MPIKEEAVADPPASRTFPFGSRMAAACQRRSCIESVNVHLPVAGSNNSALERKVLPAPPAARTFPLDNSVAAALWRGVFEAPGKLPGSAHRIVQLRVNDKTHRPVESSGHEHFAI